MAVPMCCHQKVSSIWKTLDVITRRKVSTINREGKWGGGVVAEGGAQVDDGLYANVWLDIGVHGSGVCSEYADMWWECTQVCDQSNDMLGVAEV
jgi:hypothetical protein